MCDDTLKYFIDFLFCLFFVSFCYYSFGELVTPLVPLTIVSDLSTLIDTTTTLQTFRSRLLPYRYNTMAYESCALPLLRSA